MNNKNSIKIFQDRNFLIRLNPVQQWSSNKYLRQSNCDRIWKSTVLLSIHSKRILLKFQSLEGLNHLVINQGLISHLLSRSSSSANISVVFLGSLHFWYWKIHGRNVGGDFGCLQIPNWCRFEDETSPARCSSKKRITKKSSPTSRIGI